jgi:hypothetical protein
MNAGTGYCFKAEGVRVERCYSKLDLCLQKESVLHDAYPFAAIESECQGAGEGSLPLASGAHR